MFLFFSSTVISGIGILFPRRGSGNNPYVYFSFLYLGLLLCMKKRNSPRPRLQSRMQCPFRPVTCTWFPYVLPGAHPGTLLCVRHLVAGALVTEERQACTWDSCTSLLQPVLSAPVPPEHPPANLRESGPPLATQVGSRSCSPVIPAAGRFERRALSRASVISA